MPSLYSSSDCQGRNIKDTSGLFDVATSTPEPIEEKKTMLVDELEINLKGTEVTTDALGQTTFSDIEESITEKMTNDLLNDHETKKVRSGKQHIIDLQILSPTQYPLLYIVNQPQAPQVSQTLALAQKNGVLIDQFGNNFQFTDFPSLLGQFSSWK